MDASRDTVSELSQSQAKLMRFFSLVVPTFYIVTANHVCIKQK